MVDCSDAPVMHSMDVSAPEGAVLALVYASGHEEKAVNFLKVSFKK